MLKVLFSFLTAFFMLTGCDSSSEQKKEDKQTKEENSMKPGGTATNVTADKLAVKVDPSCKMSMEEFPIVDTMTYKGNLYGFCSAGCKEAFKIDPEGALNALAQ